MADRYLVECTRKPSCDYGTNDYHFKDAQVVKLWPNQDVFTTWQLLAMKYKAKSDGKEEGRNEAWALAQKIYKPCCDGGYPVKEVSNIFGCDDPLAELTYKEAAEKVAAWEEGHRMLEIGAVVKVIAKDHALCGKRGVITDATNTRVGPSYLVLFRDGKSCLLRSGEIERVAPYDLGSLFDLMEEEKDG